MTENDDGVSCLEISFIKDYGVLSSFSSLVPGEAGASHEANS